MKRATSARAYGVLVEGGRVLLVRSSNPRHDPPLWWLPGGGIDFAETPEETVVREFAEETGLVVTDPRLLSVTADVFKRHNGDQVHAVRLSYTVTRVGGDLVDEVGGTTDAVAWFELAGLDGLNVAGFARAALAAAQAK